MKKDQLIQHSASDTWRSDTWLTHRRLEPLIEGHRAAFGQTPRNCDFMTPLELVKSKWSDAENTQASMEKQQGSLRS